ncbi:MAG: UDP-N-acetylmuramate--L-alanine ligase [Anaerolineales bacterium]|jgi:UDP-N-acetylmuramate--L-alanine ligase/UDP-N-acetylenolpyruvoylglucosamine reductase|nr:UDP-N-acetylmuramate--L-alanine ligase [Anaerolineales bacterium]MDP7345784.1 UDP-N-acetylmuramate--L-alanine ligase [Anaerolineales bacterium]MDP7643971.1 UDP-N-acetylmuramate--L-alanine ligase [Anaerolineales bacterium]HJN41046.1 UDP-N-acetylmuramate--L-alanine ligase [Anaerolineales bacterium]|tara:strand:+ start:311 stop:2620 length:2310 start_codon:yes stop_codon:yes gene_type:complete
MAVETKEHIHLIGIGGAGLSAIATVLLESGHPVSGSDVEETALTERLKRAGARVYVGHRAENLAAADMVLPSSAIPESNPELQAARAQRIKVLKRQELLGMLMADRVGCAVAGTHGKTTTTALLATCLLRAGFDPTFIVGGVIRDLGINARHGRGEPFVIEADEYERMFLGLRPKVAIITNVDYDHPDCYSSMAEMEAAFCEFAMLVPPDGRLIINQGDVRARALGAAARDAGAPVVTYALRSEADWRAEEIDPSADGGCDFTLRRPGSQPDLRAQVGLLGEHNLSNALAVLAAADFFGVSAENLLPTLSGFSGVERRFELKGEAGGVTVIDDYAHHPTEIRATLRAARSRFRGRQLWVLFQPHTFTRTRALLAQFAASLDHADHVALMDIFPSREVDDGAVSSADILKLMEHDNAHLVGAHEEAARALNARLRPGDVLITLGAGDGYKVGERVLELRRNAGAAASGDSEELFAQFGGRVCRHEPLARYTSARIGGPVDYFIQAHSADELAGAVQAGWRAGMPVTVFGAGSNVLVSDRGIRGLVVQNQARRVEFVENGTGLRVRAESGTALAALAHMCVTRGAAGLEWAVSVPGTVGGAVIGNAGAHGGDVAGAIFLADILQRGKGTQRWPVEALQLDYRTSRLKAAAGDFAVLNAEFALTRAEPEVLKRKAAQFSQLRREMQPPGASIGSMFKNPPGDYAGQLLEAAGLKGMRIGQAEISRVHANFFVNLGEATAAQVRELIDCARETVRREFNVELELEIQLLGDWS